MFCESCARKLTKEEVKECNKKYNHKHYYCRKCRRI